MTIVNEIRNHGYITLKHIFAREIARENLFFKVLLTIIFFLKKNSKELYSDTTIKKNLSDNSCCKLSNRQYQLNFK